MDGVPVEASVMFVTVKVAVSASSGMASLARVTVTTVCVVAPLRAKVVAPMV